MESVRASCRAHDDVLDARHPATCDGPTIDSAARPAAQGLANQDRARTTFRGVTAGAIRFAPSHREQTLDECSPARPRHWRSGHVGMDGMVVRAAVRSRIGLKLAGGVIQNRMHNTSVAEVLRPCGMMARLFAHHGGRQVACRRRHCPRSAGGAPSAVSCVSRDLQDVLTYRGLATVPAVRPGGSTPVRPSV